MYFHVCKNVGISVSAGVIIVDVAMNIFEITVSLGSENEDW